MSDFLLNVNGADCHLHAPGDETLLFALRDGLHLTGTKYGCGEGECGACTVLIDGAATRSCQVTVASAVGGRITTIEGLEHNGVLSPVQQAFLEEGAFQCGYCTSGMILTATALLHEHAHPTDQQIVTLHGWQYLPLRNLSAHRGCGQTCLAARKGRVRSCPPMS